LELPHVVISSLRRPPGTSARAAGSPEDCCYDVSLACGWMENCILRNVTTPTGTCVTSARYKVPLAVAHAVSIHPPTLLPPDNATIRLHEWIHAMVGLLFVQKKDFFFFVVSLPHIVIPSLRRPPGTSARAAGPPEDCWYDVSLETIFF
jgi:hypothetical protein